MMLRNQYSTIWLPRAHRRASVAYVLLPLWIPAVLFLAAGAAWCIQPPYNRSICKQCRYALDEGMQRCPECGSAVDD